MTSISDLPDPDGSILSWDDDDPYGDFDVEGRTAEVIKHLAALKLVTDDCLDITHGEGVFWRIVKPAGLVTNDIEKPADHNFDYTGQPPDGWLNRFETVCYDPRYKLNGTPTDSDRYGAHVPMKVADIKRSIISGMEFAMPCVAPGGTLISKVQNQIANGSFHDLEFDNTVIAKANGLHVEARCYMPHEPRPQRSQRRARNNLSIFTVYRKPKRARI